MTTVTVETKEAPQEDAIKETFESIVIAFILAFVFRAYVVEAFVIPTGSMAPTLLGEHLRMTCGKCGYHYKVDNPYGQGGPRRTQTQLTMHCPMCQASNIVAANTYISSGDRILVHKYLYSFEEPQRFDVVVFKAPEGPQTNYIKRLLGLPGQMLLILEGNVYYNPTPEDEKGWRIARKTDTNENRHAMAIQNTLWQPLYRSQYVPIDFGKKADRVTRDSPWRVPWTIVPGEAQGWRTAKTEDGAVELDPRGGYVHEGAGKGAIHFDFRRVWSEPGIGAFAYSQGRFHLRDMHMEDVRLAAHVEPKQDGLGVKLITTARLDDPAGKMHNLVAAIDALGNVTLTRGDQPALLGSAKVSPFLGGRSRHVELWYVDQEASVWVDGERLIVARFDMPYETLLNRAMPAFAWGEDAIGPVPAAQTPVEGPELMVPRVAIQVSGSPVRLHRVELDRDLYYTHRSYDSPYHPRVTPGQSAIYKSSDGQHYEGRPAHLLADQFFCMGDNSPSSYDSRMWSRVDGWVHKRAFAPDISPSAAAGIVPRRVMMGKAFFVYFPSMIGLSPEKTPLFPNFGEMRFIH